MGLNWDILAQGIRPLLPKSWLITWWRQRFGRSKQRHAWPLKAQAHNWPTIISHSFYWLKQVKQVQGFGNRPPSQWEEVQSHIARKSEHGGGGWGTRLHPAYKGGWEHKHPIFFKPLYLGGKFCIPPREISWDILKTKTGGGTNAGQPMRSPLSICRSLCAAGQSQPLPPPWPWDLTWTVEPVVVASESEPNCRRPGPSFTGVSPTFSQPGAPS